MRSCAVGHLRVDAFGYPTCVTSDDENTGIARQAVLGHSGKDVHETTTTATHDASIMDEEGSD